MHIVDHAAPQNAADRMLFVSQILDNIVRTGPAPPALTAGEAEFVPVADVDVSAGRIGMVIVDGVFRVVIVVGVIVHAGSVGRGHVLLQEVGGDGVLAGGGNQIARE